MGERDLVSPSLLIRTSPIRLGPHSYDLTYLYLPQAPSPNTVLLRARASTYEFWEHNSVHDEC